MFIYPTSTEPARCKLCLVPIFWALTFPNRKKVPLDRPIITQTLAVDADGQQFAKLVSTTHFETCAEYDPATQKAKTKAPPKEQARLF